MARPRPASRPIDAASKIRKAGPDDPVSLSSFRSAPSLLAIGATFPCPLSLVALLCRKALRSCSSWLPCVLDGTTSASARLANQIPRNLHPEHALRCASDSQQIRADQPQRTGTYVQESRSRRSQLHDRGAPKPWLGLSGFHARSRPPLHHFP